MPDRVIVDTSAFYALISEGDLFHDRAKSAYERLVDRERTLLATSYTVVETVALLHRRLGFEAVEKFSEWRASRLDVLWIDDRIHQAAWNQFIAAKGERLSFVDWTTVVASRVLEAPVFTFDGGFAAQGLPVVPR